MHLSCFSFQNWNNVLENSFMAHNWVFAKLWTYVKWHRSFLAKKKKNTHQSVWKTHCCEFKTKVVHRVALLSIDRVYHFHFYVTICNSISQCIECKLCSFQSIYCLVFCFYKKKNSTTCIACMHPTNVILWTLHQINRKLMG